MHATAGQPPSSAIRIRGPKLTECRSQTRLRSSHEAQEQPVHSEHPYAAYMCALDTRNIRRLCTDGLAGEALHCNDSGTKARTIDAQRVVEAATLIHASPMEPW